MATKKTLYEVLGIPANSSFDDVRAAHQRKVQALQSEETQLGHDEFKYRLQLLDLSLHTLSDPSARRDYDEKLMSRKTPGADAPQRQAVVVQTAPDTLTRRAEALALRADALALRADAMSIHTDILTTAAEDARQSWTSQVLGILKSSMRTIAITIGALAGLAIVTQVAIALSVRNNESIARKEASAEEKVIIQEYYQQYGVRPASAAEARLLEQENQRRERAEREAEREEQRKEEAARRFEEDSRRTGERVSAELRAAEERIRREEAYAKARREEEERRKIAEEEDRLEREQAKWRQTLAR